MKDPCCGSGHILVYMFEVLMQIYQSQGYSAREAAVSIVEHNIYGLDIDKRAVQLAYFAVMMKARQYDRRFLTRGIQPQVFYIEESNGINCDQLKYFGADLSEIEKNNALNQVIGLLDQMQDAREYGSILIIDNYDWELLRRFAERTSIDGQMSFDSVGIEDTQELLQRLINLGNMLARQYEIVVTNPPYMGKGKSLQLSTYLKNNYDDSKGDLYSAFIERCRTFSNHYGLYSMITQHSWMFLSSYEQLRNKMESLTLVNMCHLGARAFEDIGGEVVQTAAFTYRNSKVDNYISCFVNLTQYDSQASKEQHVLSRSLRDIFLTKVNRLDLIEGKPLAYWVSDKFLSVFKSDKLENLTISDGQNKTGNNERYLRELWEVNSKLIGPGKKWVQYAKGGSYRKWSGNINEVINWSVPAREHYHADPACRIVKDYLWYKKGITWGIIAQIGFRELPEGSTFDMQGSSIFLTDYSQYYCVLAFINSKVALSLLQIFNTTLSFQIRDIRNLPYKKNEITKYKTVIDNIAEGCIKISQKDWNSFETSWDFNRHPLCPSAIDTYDQIHSQFAADRMSKFGRLSWHYDNWKRDCEERFKQLKANEEELNRIFIDIYGLQDELTPEEDDKDVTVRLADLTRDIKSFISYAVGCMFGRYSLDVDGLAYAGGDWDDSKYKTFLPDADNVIPITDEEYLDDDIVSRFIKFVMVVYGEQTLEENLTFIADALGGKGKSSREVIRNYFLKEFFKDHCKTYQKRPIYWLYDSGKQNGFKALVYLHRMDENTTGKVRADYLHRMEQIYGNEVIRMQDVIDHDKSAHQVSLAEKRMDKLKKQIKECQDYDAKLGHLALDQIKLNLDDGVKVNYRKAQTGRDGEFYEVLADSKNIMANDALWKEYLTEWPHEEE